MNALVVADMNNQIYIDPVFSPAIAKPIPSLADTAVTLPTLWPTIKITTFPTVTPAPAPAPTISSGTTSISPVIKPIVSIAPAPAPSTTLISPVKAPIIQPIIDERMEPVSAKPVTYISSGTNVNPTSQLTKPVTTITPIVKPTLTTTPVTSTSQLTKPVTTTTTTTVVPKTTIQPLPVGVKPVMTPTTSPSKPVTVTPVTSVIQPTGSKSVVDTIKSIATQIGLLPVEKAADIEAPNQDNSMIYLALGVAGLGILALIFKR